MAGSSSIANRFGAAVILLAAVVISHAADDGLRVLSRRRGGE
jgi:hypothetical protein